MTQYIKTSDVNNYTEDFSVVERDHAGVKDRGDIRVNHVIRESNVHYYNVLGLKTFVHKGLSYKQHYILL